MPSPIAVDICESAPACGNAQCPATLECLSKTIFPSVINAALTFAGVATVILIIVAGIKYITAGGDNKQVEGAQKTLTYAIIGLAVVLFSFLIINVISYVTGVSCITGFDVTGKNCK